MRPKAGRHRRRGIADSQPSWRRNRAPMLLAQAITELGEPTLLIPLSVLLCTFLAIRSRAWALRWTQAFLLCAVGITALKVCFIACPQGALGLRSPSGHAAISSLFFPSLFWFAAADRN